MSKIIKKAFGDNSHYKLFRYPYDDTQIHEEDTINNEKIVIKWIGNDQEELYFYNNCLTKVKEIEPNLCVYQIDKNKDLVIGWKRKDEATPRVELSINTVRERVLTASNQEVTPSTILHIGDKIHFAPTASSNIQRYNTEAHDSDSITWTTAKTIIDYGEIQLNYQKVELTSIDQDPKTPFTIVNNSKANIVITNPYDNNKVVHTGDAVFYKHNFFHATMNENYAFDPDNSQFIELVDKSANLYRITDNNPYFNIKYAGKVKIVIQDPSNYNAEYRAADGGLISNNDMMPVGSIIKIRLTRDNVDLKDMPEHTTLVSQTFWNTDDDPYDLRKDYNVKINEEEDLTTITLKPPQPQPSTVFKTNANKYNDKVTVESHINHVTADPLPSDPTWFSQFEVVKISFKGNYGETGYKIDSVQNAIHCGEDYYQANGAECIINISEVSDYKLRILKSAPGVTAEECGVYDMEVQNKKYPDGAILSLNKIIRIIPQENFIIDQDRLADLELVDSNMSTYKVTGNFPTIAVKEELAVFKIPDEDHVRVRRYDNNVQINNGDTLRIGTAFTVTFPNKYKLKGGKIKGAKKEYSLENVYYAMEHEVEVIIEERPFATINVTSSLPYTLKALTPSVKPITSLPNSDTLRVDDKFSIEFNNEDDRTSNKFVVTGAIPSITKINGESIKCFLVTETTVNAEAKPKVVTFTNHNEDVYKVTKFPEGDLIPTGYTGLKIGQKIKIELLDDGYQLNILGLERLDSEYPNDLIYKITGEQVDIFGIPFPFVTVNNANPDIIAISKKNDISKAITTYPNTDTIRRGSSFYIFFKPPYSESTHTLKVEGATLDNNRYVAYDDIYVSATAIPSKLKLEGEFAGLKVTAESDGRELHDGDTSIHKGDLIELTFQPNYMLDGAVIGAELTDATNNIYKITEELVTIKVKCKVKLKIVTHQTPPEVTVMDPTHMTTYHNDDEIEVGSKIAILPKPGFAVDSDKIVDIELVDTDQSIYKITGLHPTVECKQVNAIIHIPDEAHVDVFTVPGNEQIHDNDITQKLNNQLKVISKYPYKLKNNAIAGMEVVDADNGIYKITEYTVTIELEELEFASIDTLPADIFKVKTVRTPIQEITTFPNNNTLRITDKFTLEFKNSDDGIKYDVGVTGATLISGNTYRVESNIVSITAEDKQVTVHIHNSTHVTVTKHPSNTPVVDGDTTVKILDILKIVPEEGYKVSTTTGLEADPLNENCYKVKETNVVIDVETYPFITINNQNTDVLAVCTTNNISTAISTFPNSDKIRKTASFYILYKGSNNTTTHSIVVTGATLVSGNKYIATEDSVEVKAVPKFTPSKINISGETTGVTVKAVDDGRELHDGDTSVKVDDKITVVLKPTYKFEVPMTGVEATGNSNEYKITDTEVTIKVKQIQFVTIDNESPTIITVKTIDPEEEITTFPCTDKLQEGQLFSVTFKIPVDAAQYMLSVIGANHTTGDQYIPTANSITIKAVRKVVIHIPDETHVQVTKVPENTQIHNNDNTLAINDQIKIVAIPKWEYKLKPVVGATVVDVDNGIYKITAVDVTIEAESVPFITINNDSTDLLKVVTTSVPSEELTVFPCSDKVHEDENFIVSFKLASNVTKYDVIVTGATRVAGNIYKATTSNITVKAEAKFPPATIHIIDGDHVDVADATSGRVILDNDTLMFVGDTITVVPKSGYRLKQKVGLELLSKPSKLYKIANASVTIEVEEIPTPPAPPPGSMTHNTILWYLKSLFYGGV